jgi:pimeloyl-ACP methyl ester carboxylesterase
VIGVHLFPGVGHMPHLEARGEVARLVTELAAAGD